MHVDFLVVVVVIFTHTVVDTYTIIIIFVFL